jgi:hypothetical protein
MAVIFKSEDKEFELGQVSFGWLDKHDVFDKYQEDDDYYSECVFKTSKDNVKELAEVILACANFHKKLREDIREKLIKFSKFIENSNGVEAFCDE